MVVGVIMGTSHKGFLGLQWAGLGLELSLLLEGCLTGDPEPALCLSVVGNHEWGGVLVHGDLVQVGVVAAVARCGEGDILGGVAVGLSPECGFALDLDLVPSSVGSLVGGDGRVDSDGLAAGVLLLFFLLGVWLTAELELGTGKGEAGLGELGGSLFLGTILPFHGVIVGCVVRLTLAHAHVYGHWLHVLSGDCGVWGRQAQLVEMLDHLAMDQLVKEFRGGLHLELGLGLLKLLLLQGNHLLLEVQLLLHLAGGRLVLVLFLNLFLLLGLLWRLCGFLSLYLGL